MFLVKNCRRNSIAMMACMLIVCFATSMSVSFANEIAAPEIDMPEDNFSDSGYIKIKWAEGKRYSDAVYQLVQSETPDFEDSELIYEGPDRASFISGLQNGNYYFRVRRVSNGDTSPWSSTILVRVKHHSLAMAFSLASIGIVVFLLTAGVVISGIKKDKES